MSVRLKLWSDPDVNRLEIGNVCLNLNMDCIGFYYETKKVRVWYVKTKDLEVDSYLRKL